MMPEVINSRTVILSDKGGQLHFVEDGEILMSVAIPPGRVRAKEYLPLVPEGSSIELGDGLVAFQPRHRIGVQSYGPGSHDTGANPDFRPTSASRLEREMRLTMSKMQAATARVEAREKALAKIERIPKAKPVEKPAADPVIEPVGKSEQ